MPSFRLIGANSAGEERICVAPEGLTSFGSRAGCRQANEDCPQVADGWVFICPRGTSQAAASGGGLSIPAQAGASSPIGSGLTAGSGSMSQSMSQTTGDRRITAGSAGVAYVPETAAKETSVVNTVTKGIQDAFYALTGKEAPQEPASQQEPSGGQQEPLQVETASILPPGSWPWVLGGVAVLALGAGAIVIWNRRGL